MNDIKDYVATMQKLLPVGSFVSPPEAERRSGLFLEAMAKLADWKHVLTAQKIKLLSTQSVVYAEELSKTTGKTVTENKLTVEASVEYITAREDFEGIENDISYIKTVLEIFNNGHIFYRNLAKDNS